MFTLIKYMINDLNFFYGLLGISFLCMVICITFYNKSKEFSFFLLYIALTYDYFFVMLTINVSSISVTYVYYCLIFVFYHVYFTFSKRFVSRTYIVIRAYLRNLQYRKLMLWGVCIYPDIIWKSILFFNSL